VPFSIYGVDQVGEVAQELGAFLKRQVISLQELHVDTCELTQEGLACIENAGACALASSPEQNKTLETLRLESNDIGSEGAMAVAAALCSNDSLKEIDLSDNPIGDDGAASFANMLR
jgi:Ran GTPase-activating protein (RanGAP) involved in mRNA processing and transport